MPIGEFFKSGSKRKQENNDQSQKVQKRTLSDTPFKSLTEKHGERQPQTVNQVTICMCYFL